MVTKWAVFSPFEAPKIKVGDLGGRVPFKAIFRPLSINLKNTDLCIESTTVHNTKRTTADVSVDHDMRLSKEN